jgi:hypothetical protein
MVHVSRFAFGRLKPNEYFFERNVVYPDATTSYKERVSIKVGVDKIRVAKKRENLATGKPVSFYQPLMFKQEVEQIIDSIHNVVPNYMGFLEKEKK